MVSQIQLISQEAQNLTSPKYSKQDTQKIDPILDPAELGGFNKGEVQRGGRHTG